MSRQPLAVCWGMGQDSTGMLVGMWERGIRPQLVITADVGSERPQTYVFRPIFDDWLGIRGIVPSDGLCRVGAGQSLISTIIIGFFSSRLGIIRVSFPF